MRGKIVLNSSVFLWRVSNKGLLYNYTSGTFKHFSLEYPGIRSLCSQWENLDNLYSAYFDPQDKITETFVNSLVQEGFGIVCDEDVPVVSFPPVLKINRSIDRKEMWGGVDVMPVLPNLTHLRVFIGGKSKWNDWFKQIAYPINSHEHLKASRLFKFLSRCDLYSLTQIDFVVSAWDENLINDYCEGLSEMNLNKKVVIFYADINPGYNNDCLEKLETKGYAITQVCPPESSIERANWSENRNYQLLARNEDEVAHWEYLLGEKPSVHYSFKPIADNNLEFFRKDVFLSEEEILSQKLTKKDIYRHQALNVNQFGTFYIFPDGTIHPAADAPAIGTIDDPIHQTIIRELEENHAWRQTRMLMEPCKNCIYHDLCPSPSVYERILGVPGCTYWKG